MKTDNLQTNELQTDVFMKTEHKRTEKKPKVSFSMVMNKFLIGATILTTVAGIGTTTAFAASAEVPFDSSTTITQNYELSIENQVYNLQSTLNTIKDMQAKGIVTEDILINLATQLMELDRAVNASNVTVSSDVVNVVKQASDTISSVKSNLGIMNGLNKAKAALVIVQNSIADKGSSGTITKVDYQAKSFPDVQPGWYYDAVTYLAGRNGIGGYPDGTFGPSNTITYAEFLKICVSSATQKVYTSGENEPWYNGVYGAAIEAGVITAKEVPPTKMETAIPREDMALILVRVNQKILGQAAVSTTGVQNKMGDYSSISSNRTDFVLQAYKMGLIVGDAGNFKPAASTSRAEAAVVMHRLLVPEVRTDYSKLPDVGTTQAVFDQIPTYTQDVNAGLSFNGVGYTVQDASLLAYNYASSYCNYDGTNLAAMDARYNTLISYATTGTKTTESLTAEKQRIIAKGSKAQSDIYMTASKVEIKEGRFYAHGTAYDHVSGVTYNITVKMGSDPANPTKMAVESISFVEVK